MKLNNKGFAITAILYTLLILFSLILISIIGGLNSRNKILEKSIDNIETKYNWDCVTIADNPEIEKVNVAPLKGKYIYTYSKDDNTIDCYTYLLENTVLNQIAPLTFTRKECNDNKENLTFKGYCIPKE